MKQFLYNLKRKLPFYKSKLIDSIPFLLIYQALLFILSPIKLNQVILVIMIVIFTLTQFVKD
jgi:hypothetical protein